MAKRKGGKDKKKNRLVAFLFMAIFLMAVGYAAYSTDLEINAVGKIYSDWDVRFSNSSCAVTSEFGAATAKGENKPFCSAGGTNGALITDADQLNLYSAGIDPGAFTDGKGGLLLDLYTEFFSPTDQTVFTIDISNYSAMWDAEITDIVVTPTPTASDYIIWTIASLADGDIVKNTSAAPLDKKTFTITATWNPALVDTPPAGVFSKPGELTNYGTKGETYSEDTKVVITFEAKKP